MKFTLKSTPSIYIFSIVASLLLSTWSAYIHSTPNPDATYYLQAAELFAEGRWNEAVGIYRWPFYSLAIAAVITSVGASSYVAAQILNATLDCATAAIFIGLVQNLMHDKARERIVFWGAVVILLHPRLMVLRPVVIRDHGYLTFFLLVLYLLVRDQYAPKTVTKIAILLSILAASLFRFEALILLVFVPAFYLYVRASTAPVKALIIIGVLITCVLFVPGSVLWTSGTIIPKALSRTLEFSDFIDPLNSYKNRAWSTADSMAKLFASGRNIGGIAFVGAIIAITIDTFLRATTFPIGVLAVLAFTPDRLLSPHATKLVVWFAGWQLPILITFMAVSLVLDWRYAMAFALILTAPAVFTVYEVEQRWRAGAKNYQLFFAVTLLALVIPWLFAVARLSKI